MYSCTPSLTSALEWMGGQCKISEVLNPLNEPVPPAQDQTGVEKLVLKWIRSPDRQARSE